MDSSGGEGKKGAGLSHTVLAAVAANSTFGQGCVHCPH